MHRYAAIDIGSNSIRMLAAEMDGNQRPQTLAEDRQVTRLGSSVFETGYVNQESMELVCGVLERMSAAYRKYDVLAARVVATAAVRDARNQDEFLERASQAAGAKVEVISGQEEARLIFHGVQSRWPHRRRRVLVIDIGGGSAEVILGEEGRIAAAFSRPLGAVRLSSVFLKSDPPSPADLNRMKEYIEEKLTPAVRRIGRGALERAIGTSATASAVVCAANRIPRARRAEADRKRVTAPQLKALYEDLSTKDLAARRKITGIGPRRAEIIVPGVAVLLRVLRDLGIPSLYYSAAGLRDGIVIDLAARGAGRVNARLAPEQRKAVEEFARRFGVDLKHARKVASFVTTLFDALLGLHRLPPEQGRLVEAAAYLRDVGHVVNDSSHHKHSFYIVSNADLGGFDQTERQLIAALCRYHRKSMPVARHPEFQTLTAEMRRSVLWLAPLLRIADALDRGREQRVESIECAVSGGQVSLTAREKLDTALEQWAVEIAGQDFQQVYGKALAFRVERAA
ncbi:MAG: Ppx/GppA family phosphatase [Bryobacterales bacterium]|nr:Ppx/GppA family phosphatase [Bryobacterales bacterium]